MWGSLREGWRETAEALAAFVGLGSVYWSSSLLPVSQCCSHQKTTVLFLQASLKNNQKRLWKLCLDEMIPLFNGLNVWLMRPLCWEKNWPVIFFLIIMIMQISLSVGYILSWEDSTIIKNWWGWFWGMQRADSVITLDKQSADARSRCQKAKSCFGLQTGKMWNTSPRLDCTGRLRRSDVGRVQLFH